MNGLPTIVYPGETQPVVLEIVTLDDDTPWYLFDVSYIDNISGHEYTLYLYATDFEDAERRLALIGSNGGVRGQLVHVEKREDGTATKIARPK